MPTKSQKSWTEIELAITAMAVTATLGFWSLFSAPAQPKTVQTVEPASPPPPAATDQPAPAALPLRQVKIIYGGQMPVQQVVQVTSSSAPVNVARVVAAPAKPARTGSSKP